MRQLRTLALGVICVLTGASTAGAQPPIQPPEIVGWSIVPALQLAAIYEKNVLFTPKPQTDGTYFTLVPSFEARHRGPVGTFNAGYSVNSERHTGQLRSLNDMFARQLGAIGFESKPSPRSSVSGMARYMSTRRPEDLLDPTGLAAPDRRTTGFLANVAIDHSVTPASRVNFRYTVSVDDYGHATETRPGARNTLHWLVAGLAKQTSPRTTIGVEYGGKFLIGEEFGADTVTRGMFWSNIIGVRWRRSFTPRLTASLLAGPRAGQVVPPVIAKTATTPVRWEIRPEVLASLTFRTTNHAVSLAYANTQFLGVGASGLIDTKSIEVTAAARISRLRLSTRPGIYRNTLAGLTADSYRFDGTASYQASSWISVDAIYLYRHQSRSLALADYAVTAAARAKTRNRLVVGMTVRRPIHM